MSQRAKLGQKPRRLPTITKNADGTTVIEALVTPSAKALPGGPSTSDLVLLSLDEKMDRLVWLSEGPDSYETIDDTNISTTTESPYRFPDFVIWAITLLNNSSAGNFFVRWTTSYGRIKQYKIPATKSISINDIKGGYGSEFRVIADTAGMEFIAFVSLKSPLPIRATSFSLR